MSEQPIYRSSNGDAWYLSEDPATGRSVVKHVGNPESGGHISVGVEEFLANGHGPEHEAVRDRVKPEPMATILIVYDIHPASGPRYDALVEAIQSLGQWWHHLETVWIVRSNRAPDQIRERLQSHIGFDDQLLVIDISGAKAGWAGINDTGSSWLKKHVSLA